MAGMGKTSRGHASLNARPATDIFQSQIMPFAYLSCENLPTVENSLSNIF